MWVSCSVCGQEFVTYPGYAYKLTYQGRIRQCCSYSCFQEMKKLKEHKSKKGKNNEETGSF